MTVSPPNWTLPETWLLAGLLLALLVMPIWLIGRRREIGKGRKAVRLVLHGLLWLAVLGLWGQPRWQQTLPPGSVLLAADNVPASFVGVTAARLGLKTTLSARAFRALKTALPVDTVWLLGQDFPGNELAKLSRQVVKWLPYDVPGQLQQLRWKGIIRQGEQQVVTGKINTAEGGTLRLKFGNTTVDSTRLLADNQLFKLSYISFSQGRTPLTLWLDKTVLDTIRFVARPAEKLRVRFVLDAPDFETRALADWLGQQGNTVELTNRLSTGIGNELNINKPTAGTARPAEAGLPDLVITDPANVANQLVSKSLMAGKSVLILNLTRPDVDVPSVNRALRTRFQVRRIPGKDTVRVGPDLTALPFRFEAAPAVLPVAGYPVVIQSAAGRVGVSLLAETFPLRLSGDTTAYARLWLSILAPLRPTGQNNVAIDAPVLVHQPARFVMNNAGNVPTRLRVGTDTLVLQPAPVNTRSYAATGRFARAGWLPVQDTLAVYAYGVSPNKNGVAAVAQREEVAGWVRAHRQHNSPSNQTAATTARTIEKAIPDWGWLLIIALILSALWLEPKVI